MASPDQIRGALLEEAILFLLKTSGFEAVADHSDDPMLSRGSAGLNVNGRGGSHQIDAIADFRVGHPFTYPPRLLVEAKAFGSQKAVGLEVVRNAVGVLKDINEAWMPSDSTRTRHHYHYAIFTTTRFSKPAQKYAFAHDIYLLPLANSPFLQPLTVAINEIDTAARWSGRKLRDVRDALRERLHSTASAQPLFTDQDAPQQQHIEAVARACRTIRGSLLAMISRTFPVFLVPQDGVEIDALDGNVDVRVTRDESGWYLHRSADQSDLFSFDLPAELFDQYAHQGLLTATAALDLKSRHLSEIHAYVTTGDSIRLITFKLDQGWLATLHETLHHGQDTYS